MPEPPPASLAQMLTQRRRLNPREATPAPHSVAQPGQLGLLFVEPEPAAPAKRERKLWGVAELVGVLRGRVEREYADEWVEGEVSNCRPAPSGHLYFTLKDDAAQLPVVLFRRQAALLRFKPQDGQTVLVKGRVSVFEGRGQLQMIAETLEPRGAGALQLAFEQLKERLRAEGLFDAERKRSLPAFPRTVGVITSPRGAVIHDIVSVCRRRHACLNLLVYPAAVQGPNCAGEVAAGLRYFGRTERHRVDLILIARGGGSAEDLAGFNEESLARAIANSAIPTVSAVGHETDFTIADFVADLRAPTPSAAAELITAAQHRVEERVHALEFRLGRAMRYRSLQARQRYAEIGLPAVLARTRDGIGRRQQRVDELRFRLDGALSEHFRGQERGLGLLLQRLREQEPSRRVRERQGRLEQLRARLERAKATMLTRLRQRAYTANVRLQTLSPDAVLKRGYALVFAADGSLIRSAEQVRTGDAVRTRLASGAFTASVTVPEPETGPEREMGTRDA